MNPEMDYPKLEIQPAYVQECRQKDNWGNIVTYCMGIEEPKPIFCEAPDDLMNGLAGRNSTQFPGNTYTVTTSGTASNVTTSTTTTL